MMGMDMCLYPQGCLETIEDVLKKENDVAYWKNKRTLHEWFRNHTRELKKYEDSSSYVGKVKRQTIVDLLMLHVHAIAFGKRDENGDLVFDENMEINFSEFYDMESVIHSMQQLTDVLVKYDYENFVYAADW